ncbi:MAG: serine hydrolase [Candidatus Aminicenantes bacterium]|jgi:CubicO group peptidase (beta-lactamase class C family)
MKDQRHGQCSLDIKKILVIFLFTTFIFSFGLTHREENQKIEPEEFTSLTESPYSRFTDYDNDPYDWPVSSPEEQGIDSRILTNATNHAERLGFMFSLLVIRNGNLIVERYYNGTDKYYADHTCSTGKSYTSALVGIALRENYLSSLDQKMMDFFPEYAKPDLDPRKYDITIRNLLQMRAGYPFEEDEDFIDAWYESADMMKFAIEVPLATDIDQTFAYSSHSSHILSGIITKATGMSTYEFAKNHLFDPLGVSVKRWDQDSLGYYFGFGWIWFSPRDMARFGYLYLNNGMVNGQQIIPAEWIEESVQSYSENASWFKKHFKDIGYGYQWWLAQAGGYDVCFALGHGGQVIVNVPELNMVIVTTANWEVSPEVSGYQINAVLNLIANFILTPIRGHLEQAPYSPSEVSVQKVENRGLFTKETISAIKWLPNSRNSSESVAKYRIYRLIDEYLSMIAEVDANTFEYWHRNVDEGTSYIYAISAVTSDDRESTPMFVSVN